MSRDRLRTMSFSDAVKKRGHSIAAVATSASTMHTAPVLNCPTMALSAGVHEEEVQEQEESPYEVVVRPRARAGAAAAVKEQSVATDSTSSPAPVEADKPVLMGWLYKEGGSIRTWKRRFFELQSSGHLVYYDKPEVQVRQYISAVDVRACRVIIANGKRVHCFHLLLDGATKAKRARYVLAALDDQDRERWMTALVAAGASAAASRAGSSASSSTTVASAAAVAAAATASSSATAETAATGATGVVLTQSAAAAGAANSSVVAEPAYMTVSSSRSMASKVAGIYRQVDPRRNLRHLVSKKKTRYIEAGTGGFDLDLSYITPHIIAMGFPSDGGETVFRNDHVEVRRFLEEHHNGRYKVYNLCSERSYPAQRFANRVALFPFDDHNAPHVWLLEDFCVDAVRWLNRHPDNTVAVHCKAGKGRTGLMLSALLLHLGVAHGAEAALALFGQQRTSDGKGVTIPSQRRYVHYYERIRRENGYPPARMLRLRQLVIVTVPAWDVTGGCNPFVTVHDNGARRYCTRPSEGGGPMHAAKEQDLVSFHLNLELEGDIKIELHTIDRISGKEHRICAVSFNTAFVDVSSAGLVSFARDQVDGPHKKKLSKRFSENFRIDLICEQ